jgi:hypothetical protein
LIFFCFLVCPVGYEQSGTLSTNNDVPGTGLGQSQQSTIEDCKDQCEANPNCNSFMYGGLDTNQNDLCEIAAETTGTNSWGTNFRFCAKQGTIKPI